MNQCKMERVPQMKELIGEKVFDGIEEDWREMDAMGKDRGIPVYYGGYMEEIKGLGYI